MKNYPNRKAARAAVILAALSIARDKGYQMVQLNDVAALCGRTTGWVCNILPAEELRDAVMSKACEVHDLRVIAQGLATGNAQALALPEDVRRRAGEALV